MARKLIIIDPLAGTPTKADNFTPSLLCNNKYIFVHEWALILGNYSAIIDLNNYRINTNVVKVKCSSVPFEKIMNCPYIVDYDESNSRITYMRCYFVNSVVTQSDYYIMDVSLDYWQSFVYDARLNGKAVVSRCNRNIDLGYYDPIKQTVSNLETAGTDILNIPVQVSGMTLDSDHRKAPESEMTAVAMVDAIMFQDGFTGDYRTQSFLVACRADKIRQSVTNSDVKVKASTAQICAMVMAGITDTTTSTVFVRNDVTVRRVWLLPTHVCEPIIYGNDHNLRFHTLSEAGNFEFDTFILAPSSTRYFSLPFAGGFSNPNYKYTFGVREDGLELVNYTKENLIYVYFEINATDISVFVQQGNNRYDITSHFEAPLIANSKSTDMLGVMNRIFKGVSAVKQLGMETGSSAFNFVSNYEKGDIGGMVSSAISASNSVQSFKSKVWDWLAHREDAISATGNGDACFVWFWDPIDDEAGFVANPFYVNCYKSVMDEKEFARISGANFNKFYDIQGFLSLYYFMEDRLSTVADFDGATGIQNAIFLQGIFNFEGVPSDASAYLSKRLCDGINVRLYDAE